MSASRPALRLHHQAATTANAATLYPFGVQPSFGSRGTLVGIDLLGGGSEFCWDPFDAYRQELATNPNCWILGEPGNGKSALVKTLIYRQAAVYGPTRWTAIVDPKGEYQPIADALGFSTIRLRPGGDDRINPLDPGHSPAQVDFDRVVRQGDLCAALLATVLGRHLDQTEEAVLFDALRQLTTPTAAPAPTLVDLAGILARATPPGPDAVSVTARRDAAVSLALALDKLLRRSFQGMFDGPSTIDPTANPRGLVIDLSGVGANNDALGLVMVAVTGWLQELTTQAGPQRLQILDEAWALLGSRHTAGFLQRAFKLGRATGTANICIAHRVSDLGAQADDGTATAKIADGLLADAATRIVLRQASDQIATTTQRLGLTQAQATVAARLVRGRALWRIGDRTAVVQHLLSPTEEILCNTDARMTRPTP